MVLRPLDRYLHSSAQLRLEEQNRYSAFFPKNFIKHITFSFNLGERLNGGPFSLEDGWSVDFFPDRFVDTPTVTSFTVGHLVPSASCRG
jgi:hypothetical protein